MTERIAASLVMAYFMTPQAMTVVMMRPQNIQL